MKPLSMMSNMLLLAFATAMIMASPAGAFVTDPLTPSERTLLQLRGRIGDLQTLERAQRRRDFQDQQQLYRDLDRRINQLPKPRPEVPRMQQNCQLRVFGYKRLDNNCR